MKPHQVTFSPAIASVTIICVCVFLGACKPRSSFEDRLSPRAEAAWEARSIEIYQEIATLEDHPWAGSYYYGDGMGINASLTLAPKSGFVFIWKGCMGVYDRNYGAVAQTDRGSLKLSFTYKNDRDGFRGTAPELFPIRWGTRHYLIASDEVVKFCNEINSGSEPRARRFGIFYLRQGDHEILPLDAPALPGIFQAYLLGEAIRAEIVDVHDTENSQGIGGWYSSTTTVTINVGRENKVLPGMSFNMDEPNNTCLGCRVKVFSVGESTSQALLRQNSTEMFPPTQPKIGWKLTTGAGRMPHQ